ncbi:MAG TPA: hypothetical protein VGA52_09820 [Anaerolineales bacterium]
MLANPPLPSMPKLLAPVVLVLTLLFSACLAPTPMPTATPSPLPPTPTATIPFPTIPPTATEGLARTASPPVPALEGTGDLLYQTEFADAEGWALGRDAFGVVSLLDGGLSIVLPQPNGSRVSRSPAPLARDVVIDTTVRAEVCQGDSEFGLVFRLTPEGDQLRFTITCDGGLRLRRVTSGIARALIPFRQTEPAVIAGAPAENRLTVRASGDELFLYVNQVLVLQAADTFPLVGGVGLVAASGVSGQTTVLFQDLSVWALPASDVPTQTSDD